MNITDMQTLAHLVITSNQVLGRQAGNILRRLGFDESEVQKFFEVAPDPRSRGFQDALWLALYGWVVVEERVPFADVVEAAIWACGDEEERIFHEMHSK